jgi:hypothetical protein
MEFSRELRGDVISDDITVSFRLWRRPEVRVGGRYPLGPVHIEIDSMELMPFSAIAEADVRRCGEKDRESLRERAATQSDRRRHAALPGGVPPRRGRTAPSSRS